MTSVLTPPSAPATPSRSLTPLESLATATLRSALDRRGSSSVGSRVELCPISGRSRVVMHVDPRVPWRSTLGALVDVVAVVHTFDPSVQFADSRFEPIDPEA